MKIIISELSTLLISGRVTKITTDRYFPENFLRVYWLTLFASSITVFIAYALLSLSSIEIPLHILHESLKHHSLSSLILVFCLLAPLQQEIQFRLCLVYSRINISVFTSIWCFLFLNNFNEGRGIFGEQDHTSLSIALSLIIMASTYSLLHQNKSVNDRLEAFWMCYSKHIFLLSILCSTLFQVVALDQHLLDMRLIPILAIFTLLLGLILGYTRLKYGVIYALLLHIGHNVLFIFLVR
jgi:hypothetical protein